MDRFNPNALVFWIASSSIGWLIGGPTGAVWGLAFSTSASLLASFLK